MNDKSNSLCAYKHCYYKQVIKPGQDRAITKDGNFHLRCYFAWRVDQFHGVKK